MSKMIEDIIKDFKNEIMESFPDEYEKGYNAGLKKGIQALEELDKGKVVVFMDNTNASALGVVKVKNYDDRFNEAADDARFKAVNEVNNIDDLLPAIMENLEKAGYQMEKLDYHEVSA